MMRLATSAVLCLCLCTACDPESAADDAHAGDDLVGSYRVTDTNQTACYDTVGKDYDCDAYDTIPGQDGHYEGAAPSYADNGDGTVTDLITGLMWQQATVTSDFDSAPAVCAAATTGGYDDWRVPDIKELFSLMDFTGNTGVAAPDSSDAPSDAVPYLDEGVFDFQYGTEVGHARYIDAQYLTSTLYVDQVFGNTEAFFGVNFADGRIKGYPTSLDDRFLRCVRGDELGGNAFIDNGDGTVTDSATGLEWTRGDSGSLSADGSLDWADALAFCEGLELADHDDWRLPDVKELQSIVDYTRSPQTTGSAAIDPVFESTPIVNEAGQDDYGYYWSSTTHLDGPDAGSWATYVVFGRGLGSMNGAYMDVHGAGSQRSDPKSADRASIGCGGNAPQGDCVRVYNLARCVRQARW